MQDVVNVVASTEEDKKFKAYQPWKVVEGNYNYSFHATKDEAEEAARKLRAENLLISTIEGSVDSFIEDLAQSLELTREDAKQRVIDYLT